MSPRKARRARWATIGVTVLLVAGLVLSAGRLAGVLIFDWLGGGAFKSQQYPQAEQYYDANMRLNVVEPWIAVYDRGTTRSAETNFVDGENDLRLALEMAPPRQKCRVGLNLAWTIEESAMMANRNQGASQTSRLQEARELTRRLKCQGKTTAPRSFVRKTSADQKTEQSSTMKRLDKEIQQAQQTSRSQEEQSSTKKDSEQQRQTHLSQRNQQARDASQKESARRDPAPPKPRTPGKAPDKKGW